jgi:uncharacterized protein (TIGR02246 family)
MIDGLGLSERIQALEDRQAINDLLVDYGTALDNRDLDLMSDTFTENATMRHDDGIKAQGRDELVAFLAKSMARYSVSIHYPNAVRINLLGPDVAEGVVVAHSELGVGDRAVVSALRYYDKYEKGSDGRWRFADRHLRFWYFMYLDELPNFLGDQDRRRWPEPARKAELPDELPTFKAFTERGTN